MNYRVGGGGRTLLSLGVRGCVSFQRVSSQGMGVRSAPQLCQDGPERESGRRPLIFSQLVPNQPGLETALWQVQDEAAVLLGRVYPSSWFGGLVLSQANQRQC